MSELQISLQPHRKPGGLPQHTPQGNPEELTNKRRVGGQPGNHNAVKPPSSSPPPASSEPPKKRGAPVGNSNALTHGFYSRRLNPYALEGLDQVGPNTLKDEIDVMRVFSRRVAELGQNVDNLEEAKSLLHILSIATSAINRLVRTHVHIPVKEQSGAELLSEALMELEEEWPEFKKLVKKYYPASYDGEETASEETEEDSEEEPEEISEEELEEERRYFEELNRLDREYDAAQEAKAAASKDQTPS